MKKGFWTVAALIVLVAAFLFSFRACVQKASTTKDIIQHLAEGTDSAKHWRDMYNQEHARVVAVEGSRQLVKLAYSRLLDSVARLNNVKARHIEAIALLTTELSGRRTVPVTTTTGPADTSISFSYTDNWLRLSGEGSVKDNQVRELNLNYLLRDSLMITQVRKPVGLFKKATFVDVVSACPDVYITGLSSIVVRDNPKRFGIGFNAGYGLTVAGFKPFLGVGISYNLIRF